MRKFGKLLLLDPLFVLLPGGRLRGGRQRPPAALGLRARRRPGRRPRGPGLRHRPGPDRRQHHGRHRPQPGRGRRDVHELHPRHGAHRVDRDLRPRDRLPAPGQDLNALRPKRKLRGPAKGRRSGSAVAGLTPLKRAPRAVLRAPARRPGTRRPPVPLEGVWRVCPRTSRPLLREQAPCRPHAWRGPPAPESEVRRIAFRAPVARIGTPVAARRERAGRDP